MFISIHKLPAFDASEKNIIEFADDAGADTPKSRVQTVEVDDEEDDSDITELMGSCLFRARKVVLTRRNRRRRSPVESRKRLKGFGFFERDGQRALTGYDDYVNTGTIAGGGCGCELASMDRINGKSQSS